MDEGVYSGWDYFLLKFEGEVLLDRRSIFYMIIIVCWRCGGLQPDVVCNYMCLSIFLQNIPQLF